MRAVFVDTSGWLALILRNDQYHGAAAEYYRWLREQKMPLVTSDYVLDETYTRLRYHAGLETAMVAKAILDEAESMKLLLIKWVDSNIAAKAWELFKQYEDHRVSFTDCTSWSICRDLGIQQAFAFDAHFRLMGLEICRR
jgi:predicted nucleic acid-binding protein